VSGWRAFGTESLLAADPDFIIASTMEGAPDRMRDEIVSNAVLRRLTAVKEGRVLLLEADPLLRAGPRIVEAVEAMARALYPERFQDD
jgi:iron complex transport system substrate-binding protein